MLGAAVASIIASKAQEITISNVNDLVLATHTGFAALSKSRPIKVTLSGNFYASTTATFGVNLGDLSTWDQVDIELASGGVIGGDGGNGGSSSNGTGGAGGTGLELNAANSSANVSFVNNGTIRGGGGGGGGGVRSAATSYQLNTAKTPSCSLVHLTAYAGGGGAGGGRTHLNNSSGGSATTSYSPCGGTGLTNGTAGGAGTTSSRGSGGLWGIGKYAPSSGGGCSCTSSFTGGSGGNGGEWGAAGLVGTSGAAGAAGFSATNTTSVAWTPGTLVGPTT